MNQEIEGKFEVEDLEEIRQTLKYYNTESRGRHQEKNTMHDIFSIFERLNYTLRLRDNGKYIITCKGKDKGEQYNKRVELEKEIPRPLYRILKMILPTTASYSKQREEYVPSGDKYCTICLDDVDSIGNFVEIEARDEGQIELWKYKLGITSEAIKIPYFKMQNRY